MDEAIVYVDHSEIRPGGVDEVRKRVTELVEFIRAHEPRLSCYGYFIDDRGSSMTVVAVHPDSASLEFHMRVGAPEFRKLADLIDLRSIEIYGTPSETVLGQLDEKARTLGSNGRVVVHQPTAGFARPT